MTLGQADLDHVGPLNCGFFSIHTVSVFSLPCDFLNNVAFALACLIGRRHDRVHVINDPFPAALAPTTAWLCHLHLLGAEQSAPQPSGADPCFSNSVAAPGTIFSASLEGFALPAVSRLLWRMRAFSPSLTLGTTSPSNARTSECHCHGGRPSGPLLPTREQSRPPDTQAVFSPTTPIRSGMSLLV